MRKLPAVVVSILALAAPMNAEGPDVLVRFEGGIGVTPVAGVAGPANPDGTFPSVALNVVRGVDPAGPWRIADLKAVVTTDGRIRVAGRGLLLAGGNRVGETLGLNVFATLICEATAPFVERSTTRPGVPLAPDGDFRIDDVLLPPPAGCDNPVLLIRSGGSGSWFAAGIVKRQDND